MKRTDQWTDMRYPRHDSPTSEEVGIGAPHQSGQQPCEKPEQSEGAQESAAESTEGDMNSKLWAIYVPGPDEYYAAPDEKSAIEMMEKHNAAIRRLIAHQKLPWTEALVVCEVAEWPGSKEDHAAEMLDFDYVAWGIERSGA